MIVDTDDVLALFGASDRDIYAKGTIEDAIYDGTLKPAETERKTGRMSNKDWIDFLCEQFDISRTSARDMLHEMMKCKKEDNFKRIFNPMQKEGEG